MSKRVEFTPMDIPDFYNLAFGDVDVNGQIDDVIISANGDRDKVLATIACIVNIYLNKYPKRWIYFSGSTPQRMRLYKMAITVNYHELSLIYEMYIVGTNEIMPFRKNMEAVGFLIKKKNN